MACTGGETPSAPMAASSLEAGTPFSCSGVATTSNSFSFPSVHHASTVRSSFPSPATSTPFRTPALCLPFPMTPFYTAKPSSPTVATLPPGTMSEELPGCSLPRDSSNGDTSSPASPTPSLQDFLPKVAQQNVYSKVRWNEFKEMMGQKIDQHGKQVVLKQRADDEVDLKELPIENLRHLCKLNGLKQKNTDTKDNLYSKLKKYKEEFLCKANEVQNLKNKETQERPMEDNAELDQEIERAKFVLEQAKGELAETECEIENYDKELETQTLEKRKEEELATAMNAEMLQAKKRRIAATPSWRSCKKVAGRATGASTARR